VLSAVLLGLALRSKQYFILALPVLLAWNDSFRWGRLWIASGVAVLTVLPGVVLGPLAFWQAVIAGISQAEARPDSSGLTGLGIDTPSSSSSGSVW
jgi:uncharacterized membrane protein